jgi:hypothetical protein
MRSMYWYYLRPTRILTKGKEDIVGDTKARLQLRDEAPTLLAVVLQMVALSSIGYMDAPRERFCPDIRDRKARTIACRESMDRARRWRPGLLMNLGDGDRASVVILKICWNT